MLAHSFLPLFWLEITAVLLSFLIIIFYQQPIERKPKKFNPLVIPKSLEASLPFATKSKDTPSRKRPLLENRRLAVVMEHHEQKVHVLVQHLKLSWSLMNKKSILPCYISLMMIAHSF